ncbi:MAG TPA: hypothetical protein ENK42_00865 [Deltaproteobacteria bacterium]|nr:hypothetical protein [Deltaproteobacteria bacterium]
MQVRFPVDERALRYIESLESDPDVQAILSILLSKSGEEFYNYASIICFCYREEDLSNIESTKHLPARVKAWVKRKSFERDETYIKFFTHLFALYSSFPQTYEGWDRLGKFRSIFPESYIYRKMLQRYGDKEEVLISRECFVVIDDWDSRKRSKEEGQKVDVALWDRKKEKGMVFETKVKIYIKEKEHQLDLLDTIHEVSHHRITTILASFAPKQVVLSHLREFFPRRDLSRITVFGIDELSNL